MPNATFRLRSPEHSGGGQHLQKKREGSTNGRRPSPPSDLVALDASASGLRRDDCGDYAIHGKDGHIYVDGDGFLLCVSTGESVRRWGFIKKRLAFRRVTQDGDDEGALHLDHLPTPDEAELIRDALGIRKRRSVSPEASAKATAALERYRASLNRPLAF
jgi:hypothetical protein